MGLNHVNKRNCIDCNGESNCEVHPWADACSLFRLFHPGNLAGRKNYRIPRTTPKISVILETIDDKVIMKPGMI